MGKIRNQARICGLFISAAIVLPSCSTLEYCDNMTKRMAAGGHVWDTATFDLSYTRDFGGMIASCKASVTTSGFIK